MKVLMRVEDAIEQGARETMWDGWIENVERGRMGEGRDEIGKSSRQQSRIDGGRIAPILAKSNILDNSPLRQSRRPEPRTSLSVVCAMKGEEYSSAKEARW